MRQPGAHRETIEIAREVGRVQAAAKHKDCESYRAAITASPVIERNSSARPRKYLIRARCDNNSLQTTCTTVHGWITIRQGNALARPA